VKELQVATRTKTRCHNVGIAREDCRLLFEQDSLP